jgi:hypothetical protein
MTGRIKIATVLQTKYPREVSVKISINGEKCSQYKGLKEAPFARRNLICKNSKGP